MTALRSLARAFDHDALGDAQLVALWKSGDEWAARTLIKRHNHRLFRTARGILRNDAEAEDAVQEAYVRAFTGLAGFRGDSAFATWLTRILINEALGRLRRRRPAAELAELERIETSGGAPVIMFPSPPTPASPEGEAGRGQVRRMLERALDRLPDSFRAVFVLRDIEGLSAEETATLLAIKPETVKTRLFRARRLMRTEIEKDLGGCLAELFPFAGARCARIADLVMERVKAAPRHPAHEQDC
jgi:RNA polymerase sigma-70 factor (ECF subfamily)